MDKVECDCMNGCGDDPKLKDGTAFPCKESVQREAISMARCNLSNSEESCLVFAARYAHGRQTAAASVVVSEILSKWNRLSDSARSQLKREAETGAAANIDEWQRLINS